MLFLSFNKTHLSKIWLYITYSQKLRAVTAATQGKLPETEAQYGQAPIGDALHPVCTI